MCGDAKKERIECKDGANFSSVTNLGRKFRSKVRAALSEACKGDAMFADSLEAFGGGQNGPMSLSIGGPIISKFVGALREVAAYKEHLRSQVEHVLIDRLTQFISANLRHAKDCRRQFDRSTSAYDQARERFVSLKKGTREDIVAGLEELRASGMVLFILEGF
ncbi:ADP-ribosylation factor GTPase-activating protein AGD2-like protein [Drosera capensis]